MLTHMLRYHRAFSWEVRLGGQAFEYTIATLRRRYMNLKVGGGGAQGPSACCAACKEMRLAGPPLPFPSEAKSLHASHTASCCCSPPAVQALYF